VGLDQDDFVVAQDIATGPPQALLTHAKFETFLGAGDPADSAHSQLEAGCEGDVGAVEDDDLPGTNARADSASPSVVIVTTGAHAQAENPRLLTRDKTDFPKVKLIAP